MRKEKQISTNCFLLIFLLLTLLSCQTMPNIPDAVLEETNRIPLEGGARVYVFADVKAAKPILDLVPIVEMSDKQVKQMIEKTNTAVVALYPPESGRRFQVAAWGSYPSSQAGMAFGISKYWKKQRSAAGFSYWHSSAERLSIALNSKQAFVAAWTEGAPGDPVTAAPGVEYPEGLGEFRRGAVLSCWLEDPGPWLGLILEEAGIPLQIPAERMFLSLFPAAAQSAAAQPAAGQQYEAMIRMSFSSASQARALTVLLSLARSFMPPTQAGTEAGRMSVMAAVLFANQPVQDGQYLNIKTAALTEKEIALLFDIFSVY